MSFASQAERGRRASGMYTNEALMEVPLSTKSIPWFVIGAFTIIIGILILIRSLTDHGSELFWFSVFTVAGGLLITVLAFVYYKKMRFRESVLITCMIGKGIEHGEER